MKDLNTLEYIGVLNREKVTQPKRIFELLEYEAEDYNTGLEIYKDSELIKSFGNTKDRFPVYSITKSLVSMAVGIAESEGLIKITESVADCLPETFINKLTAASCVFNGFGKFEP